MPDQDPGMALGQRVAMLGIVASLALAILNIFVGLRTGSVSVFATGLEFVGDVMASSIVLLGLFVAARPPDENHPYGHGRGETVAGFMVGVVLALGGIGICWRALQGMGVHHAAPGAAAAASLLVAISIRSVMSVLKFRVGRKLRSTSLVADAWNDAVDILSASVALFCVGLTLSDPERFLAADHYGGFAVGIFVVVTGLRVVRDATLDLMDTMPDANALRDLRAQALTVAGVQHVEKAYARKTGLRWHVDLHVEVDPHLNVTASHDIAHLVREHLKSRLPWVADVLVHVEPVGRSRRE
jgi:cation diffusion facilitator family transporter